MDTALHVTKTIHGKERAYELHASRESEARDQTLGIRDIGGEAHRKALEWYFEKNGWWRLLISLLPGVTAGLIVNSVYPNTIDLAATKKNDDDISGIRALRRRECFYLCHIP